MAKYPRIIKAVQPALPSWVSAIIRHCPTIRRLAMARQLCSNAQDSTSRAMAERTIGEWWPGCDCRRFSRELPPKLVRRKAHGAG